MGEKLTKFLSEGGWRPDIALLGRLWPRAQQGDLLGKEPRCACDYLSVAWRRQDGPLEEHVAWLKALLLESDRGGPGFCVVRLGARQELWWKGGCGCGCSLTAGNPRLCSLCGGQFRASLPEKGRPDWRPEQIFLVKILFIYF